MKHFAKISYFLAVIAFFLNTVSTTRAQGSAATLVLSPPKMTFTADQSFTGQILAIAATDNSSVAPTIVVIDPGPCSQSLNVSLVNGQGPAVLAAITLLQVGGPPYGSLVCHVGVTDSRLGTAELVVTIVNGEATGPNGQFAVLEASLSFISGNPSSSSLCRLNLSATTAVNYTATAAVTSGADWLQVTPSSGTVPSGTFYCSSPPIQVQATRGALAPAVYDGTVTITPTNLGAAPPLVVDVSFTVGGNTPLQVARESVPVGTGLNAINFNYQMGKTVPPQQTVSILSGGIRPIAFSAAVSPGAPWLEIEPNGIVSSTPASITLKLTPVAWTLPPGIYGAAINVSAPEASNPDCTIPVALFINPGPLVTIGTAPTAFNFQIGGPNPPSQAITVTTSGDPITFNASPTDLTPQHWLSATPTAATASAASPQILTISVNPAGLDPGTYVGNVVVSNTVVTGPNSTTGYNDGVPITLNVSKSPLLNFAPAALSFSFQTPQQPPASQTINLSATSSLPFTIAVSARCGTGNTALRAHRFEPRPWFTVNPIHGMVAGAASVPIAVSVDPAVVTSEETCAGLITITAAGAANVIQIPVALNALAGQ